MMGVVIKYKSCFKRKFFFRPYASSVIYPVTITLGEESSDNFKLESTDVWSTYTLQVRVSADKRQLQQGRGGIKVQPQIPCRSEGGNLFWFAT